ncbi:hypothetical protein Q655_01420 [Bartonella henselae JK 51]|nr:hypothetical protein Q654_01474 [Bartonella henselae JK 50]ETS05949.1 hypothetical protein Q655_01420 [Bartonella henselae JK 51]
MLGQKWLRGSQGEGESTIKKKTVQERIDRVKIASPLKQIVSPKSHR